MRKVEQAEDRQTCECVCDENVDGNHWIFVEKIEEGSRLDHVFVSGERYYR